MTINIRKMFPPLTKPQREIIYQRVAQIKMRQAESRITATPFKAKEATENYLALVKREFNLLYL